ncbi:MAG: hypothetical protein IID39_05605, partial [Planctomycetes bacterium]|nr:hypothetical protein [Planctomycetota bacterium]
EQYADQTVHTYVYDIHDNKTEMADANTNVSTCQYDLLNRLTRKDIAPGPGVSSDTTFEVYKYDGLSRLVHAQDNDSLVTRSHNSLSNVTRETLNGQSTLSVYDGLENMVSSTYPGGRIITSTFDELERKKMVTDQAGLIATYDYVGPERITRRQYGNGTQTDFAYDGITGIPNAPGDHGVRRIIGTTHSKIADGSLIDDRTYAWDQMYNKTQRKDVRLGGPELTHDYTYDDVYRLVHSTATEPGGANPGEMAYELDGVGNREEVTTDGVPGVYFMDPQSPPADFPVNQYSDTAFDHRTYDENGNLIRQVTSGDSDGDGDVDLFDFEDFLDCITPPGGLASEECRVFDCNHDGDVDFADFGWLQEVYTGPDGQLPAAEMIYDYRNQMVEYRDTQSGVLSTYAYDASGRRIVRVVDADGDPQETRYFYDGVQVIEEQNDLGTTLTTYIGSTMVPWLWFMMTRGVEDFYYYKDDLGNVMAIGDAKGAVVERYEYEDYGQTSLFDGQGQPIEQSAIGNKYAYRSMRF